MQDERTARASISPPASAEEAAAIVAAVELLVHAGTAARAPASEPQRWLEAALIEGVERAPQLDSAHPWINT
jgi:hypothetical protein